MKYAPHSPSDVQQMLEACGCEKVEDFFRCIPSDLRADKLDLQDGMTEQDLANHIKSLASQNKIYENSFLGAGSYRHYVPSAVKSLAGRAEFVTPYTPYQPEISQGTLQVMYEYQSMMCMLTGMDACNASHYDGATAAADAGLMARRIAKKREKLVIPNNVHPYYCDVISSVCGDVSSVPCDDGRLNLNKLKESIDDRTAAVFLSFPNFWGQVEDLSEAADIAHEAGALVIAVIPEPLSLAMFKSPGDWGADIVVGEGTSFGLPVSYGGPTLGIFACREKFVRSLPGRICGMTTDADGRRSFVLTLATREQHIRRQRATSNICSNQALCATTAAIYLSLLGGEGLRQLALLNAAKASYARKELLSVSGVKDLSEAQVFNEFTVRLSKPAEEVISKCESKGVIPGVAAKKFVKDEDDKLIVCCTELNSKESIDGMVSAMKEALS